MSRMTDIVKRLGLRGLIVRGGERWKTEEIKAFLLDIAKLNKEFFHLANMNEMRKNAEMNQCMTALLHLHGPILWPPPNPDKENDRFWLYKAPCNDAPDYPVDLIFALHKDIIEPIFIRLLINKCAIYKANRDENGVCITSADYRTGRVPSTRRRDRQERASSVSSDLTEYYTDNEDDADSVLGRMDGDHVGEANTDFDPDTYHITTRSKAAVPRFPSTRAVGDGQGEGRPTLLIHFKVPSDKLRAIAAGTFGATIPFSASELATSPAPCGQKRRLSTSIEQQSSPHKKFRPSIAGDIPTPPKLSQTRRTYLPGGSGGGGRYVEKPLLEGPDEIPSMSAAASAGATDRVATEFRRGLSLLAQDLRQADPTAVTPGRIAVSEADASSRLHPVQCEHTENEQDVNLHLYVNQPLSRLPTAGGQTSSQSSSTEQRPSFRSSDVLPRNIFAALETFTHQHPQSTYSPFPEVTAAQESEDTRLLSAMRHQQDDYKIAPDDDVEIIGAQKVEHPSSNWREEGRTSQHPSSNLGMFTPNSSRRHSTVREHNEPRQSAPKPKMTANLPSRRHPTRMRTPESEGPQAPQSELQKKLSKTSLSIRSLDGTSSVHRPAAFKHCATVDHVRQELEKCVSQCIGPEKMQQAEDLLILLNQVDENRKKVEKRKYRIPLHEDFEDGWDMVEDGLSELHLGNGEKFQLTVTILMEGEE